MSSLFGVELPTPVNFIIAFVFVLLLIGAAAWLVRRFGATQIDAAARGRQPRLAVVDSAAVDGRRKLVIIRRDNVEHLLMIGGPSDVVVETNLIRGTAAATREAPVARNGGAETPPRTAAGRSDGVAAAAGTGAAVGPQCPCRGGRNLGRAHGVGRGPRAARSRGSPGAAPPTRSRVSPTRSPVPPPNPVTRGGAAQNGQGGQGLRFSSRARRRRHCPPQPLSRRHNPAVDQSLAEMAQRLEAALRRPMAQKVVTETQRVTATVDVKAGTPKGAASADRPKTQSGNLEQEMASLLSKPGKT